MKKIEVCHLKIDDLKNDFGNPRKITKEKLNELKNSIEKLDDFGVIVIDEYNNIISGNQRVEAMKQLKIKTPVLCKRLVGYSEAEKKAINVKANMSSGEFDNDILIDWIEDIKIEIEDIELPENIKKELSDKYTKKIEAPIYQITGEKPKIKDIFNSEKTDNLIEKINNSKIEEEELKRFLIYASYRHTIIDFSKVAELYAHSTKEIQQLFEDNALIIIDFNKAIEDGYVELSEDILEGLNNEL